MAKNFKLVIITMEKTVYDSEVIYIIAPGDIGYLGVLPDHAPLITSLRTGNLDITDQNGAKSRMIINGGFMEVLNNTVTILADSIL
ncbi:MAG TPA: ATP synthase F1 subunit epsilon [Nitrospiraceae bacterium]|nr:ATP synthase F1 subunit epsilon [Nitrospiraceae bacterium]